MDDDRRAFGREHPRNRFANAAAAPGDERTPALQLQIQAVSPVVLVPNMTGNQRLHQPPRRLHRPGVMP